MGKPELLVDERFKDLLFRWKNQEVLDEIVTSWTINYTDYEVMGILQKVNVAAIPVLSAAEVFNDSHLRQRNFIQEVAHPQIGNRLIFGPPWKVSGDTSYTPRRGPLVGEHNDYVFCELLGLSREEASCLIDEKVIC